MKPVHATFSRRAVRFGAACVASVVLALSGHAQVLDQIPSESVIVGKVKNLGAVSDKVAMLAKQWGLAEMTPALADPLGFLLEQGGLTKGVDKGGEAAFAFVTADFDAPKPPMIVLLPVSDYDAFLTNFQDVTKDGDVTKFKFKPAQGEGPKDDGYCAHWGNYAVFSPIKELVSKKPDGFKPAAATAKELDSKDVVVVGNFKVLGPKFTEQLKAQHDKIIDEVTKSLGDDPEKAKYAPMIKVLIAQGLSVASEFLTDTQDASFSVNLSKDGVGTSLMAEFAPDSQFGKSAAAIQGQGGSLLAGLPEAKYLLFAGGVNSPATGKVISDFLAPVEPELEKLGDQMKPVLKMIEGVKKATAAVKSQAGGLIAPTAAIGAGSLLQSVQVATGDVKTILSVQKDMMDAQQQLMAMLPNQPGGGMKMEWKPDAKTVDGVSFSQFTSAMANENDPQAMQVKSMMTMMYGPAGATGFVGAVDDQHLLTYMGLDDATVSAAIKAAKEGADTLSKTEGVMLVDKNLPEKRFAAFYLSLGDLIGTVSSYAKMMGMPIPISVKPNLPPIGMAAATEGSAVRFDSFIPSDLVEQMIATGLQLKMMGGGGNGKPGGL